MTIKGLNLTPHLVTDPVGLIAFGIGADLCCVWRRSHSMTAMNSPAEPIHRLPHEVLGTASSSLFTELRRVRVLGSPDARSCIEPALYRELLM